MEGARAQARWEIRMTGNILGSRKRVLVLLLLLVPIIVGGIVFANPVADSMTEADVRETESFLELSSSRNLLRTLRVNFRDYGLDEGTKMFVRTLATP